jgi:uncharacterized protein (DUF362 family)
MNRRDFIKTAVSAGASLAVFPGLSCSDDGPAARLQPSGTAPKSRVVEVFAPGVVSGDFKCKSGHLKGMVERGVKELTGESNLAEAWSCFVKPEDMVGIKLNSWGGRLISSKMGIMEAVVEGVRMAGVPADRIIVWDQVEENLLKYMKRRNIEPEEGGIRFRGCVKNLTKESYEKDKTIEGFDTEPVAFPWGRIRIAELLENELTAVINLPVLKQHDTAGVSGAMKNISHAVVDTPWNCHDNFCNPYIPDIVGIPGVRDKLRLHILDGIMGVAHGGPALKSMNHLLIRERLLFSTDPVAVDSIGRGWIEEACREKGFPAVAETAGPPGMKGEPAGYIAAAAEKGLGKDNPEHVDLTKIECSIEEV